MKRVLIITYYWPPSGGSGVQRWVKFAKYLPQEGWQPVVYTPENPDLNTRDDSLAAEIPAGAEILRRPIIEPYGLYRRFLGISPRASFGRDDKVTPISSGKKSFKERISLWVRGNLFVPDPKILWVRPSVRYLKKYLKENPVDVMVTTGPPQSMHLIGLEVHKATGIPWIADFRDPWTRHYAIKYLPLTKCSWRKLKKQEQAVLDNCSVVLTVTPLVQKDYQSQTSTPVAMITNGFDEEDYAAAPQTDGFFNVTQTGSLTSDGNPVVLWQELGRLSEENDAFRKSLRIRLSGVTDKEVIDAIITAGLEENLVNLGYCSHPDAIREQQRASVLVLPLRDAPEMKNILPGKVFEYLAARKPVLGFGQKDGAQAQILNETGAGVMAGWNDGETVRSFIDNNFKRWQKGGISVPEGDIGMYSRRALTSRLAALLDKVSKKNE
ncbi:MAG: glycosyltransferase [Bacteroidales bacterium]|nr:glycosyltransferase [Bacteroidales bacterium]